MFKQQKYTKVRFPHEGHGSIKTFAGDYKLSYMDSSIDLSQDDFNRVVLPSNKEEHNINRFRLNIAE